MRTYPAAEVNRRPIGRLWGYGDYPARLRKLRRTGLLLYQRPNGRQRVASYLNRISTCRVHTSKTTPVPGLAILKIYTIIIYTYGKLV